MESYRLRLYLLTALVLFGFGTLLTQLYKFQIEKRDFFQQKVPGESTVTVREPGVRGEITDRNGIVLARSKRNYEVAFNLEEIATAYSRQHDDNPTIDRLIKENGMSRVKTEKDIVAIVNEWLIPKLEAHKLAKNYNSNALRTHYLTHRGFVPFTYRTDLNYDQFASFAEHNLELPGVYVDIRPSREYPFGSLAGTVIGYLQQWEKGDIPERARREFNHYLGDDRGIAGIEATMDEVLRGPEGKRTVIRNEKGRITGIADYVRPGVGAELKLTIDARAQFLVENVLHQIGKGAAVVMDVNTGEILAMATVPNYNPQDFTPSISRNRLEYYEKNKLSPFSNRAITGLTPGSTFKIPTAITGAMHGLAGRTFTCNGGVAYGNHSIGCWIRQKGGTHGSLALPEAIQRSCNPYFMLMANNLGAQKMVAGFDLMGFGQKTGIPLPSEDPGILPGSRWWSKEFRPGGVLTPALTAMLAIGQGDASATPLQICAAVATVANGGKYFQPRLVKSAIHPERGVLTEDKPLMKFDLIANGMAPKDMEKIRHGMWLAANEAGGTAGRVKLKDIQVGAKTGTAQTIDNGRKTHNAWTAAFAPYDNPKYAVVLVVENGEAGGTVAGPLVHMILSGLFAADAGMTIPVRPMTDYPGHNNTVTPITLPEDVLAAIEATEPGETGEEAAEAEAILPSPTASPTSGAVIPKPTITPEVDFEGMVVPRAIPVPEE
jgi:penicillin-binding protein 2